MDQAVTGIIADVVNRRIFPGRISIENGRIAAVTAVEVSGVEQQVILPGFTDAHVHIESSMLVPAEFARLAAVHGTVAAVSDPHEIANVLGIEGVRFMLRNGALVPFKFFFGAPSCVPATKFESTGARLGAQEVEELLKADDIYYLSEMMDVPGVLQGDGEVRSKIQAALSLGKPVDGHAPGLSGSQLRRYAEAGISTDHESMSLNEAEEKLSLGMKVLIREGSAAKNFEALWPLISSHPGMVMFCSDDKHPDDLVRGHIDRIVKRALRKGAELLKVLEAACVAPVRHYRLPVGLLQPGDPADFIVADNLSDFNIRATYINGRRVAQDGQSLMDPVQSDTPNRFIAQPLSAAALMVPALGERIRVIEVIPGELVTRASVISVHALEGGIATDSGRDLLKLVVLNRYAAAPPAAAFVKGFGLRRGALASSIAHDSHNIVAIGANDQDLVDAINLVIESRGGIAFSAAPERGVLPLPVAGLMSPGEGHSVAREYEQLDQSAKRLGSPLPAPFMALSFLTLLVIPELKLSDRGLFDSSRFEFTPLFPETK